MFDNLSSLSLIEVKHTEEIFGEKEIDLFNQENYLNLVLFWIDCHLAAGDIKSCS